MIFSQQWALQCNVPINGTAGSVGYDMSTVTSSLKSSLQPLENADPEEMSSATEDDGEDDDNMINQQGLNIFPDQDQQTH